MRQAADQEAAAVGRRLDPEVLAPERLELRLAELRQAGDLLQDRSSSALSVGVGVGVTHASSGAEVQSELPQAVRFIGFFRLAPRAQPEIAERQQAGDLIEPLG